MCVCACVCTALHNHPTHSTNIHRLTGLMRETGTSQAGPLSELISMGHAVNHKAWGTRERKQGTGTPGVTSQGVTVKSESLSWEGLRSRTSNKDTISCGNTHHSESRGAFVQLPLNFPFRDFLKTSSLFQSKLLRRTLSSPDTALPSLSLGSAPPLFSHEDFITVVCLEHLPTW